MFTIEEFAEESLRRPSDMGIWDERIYNTHGAFISWAERGDDILSASNYRTVLEYLGGESEDVIDGSFGHWAVGSLRQIFVRVSQDGVWEDEEGDFHTLMDGLTEPSLPGLTQPYTPAFLKAFEVYVALNDYPIWDEQDYSELEDEITFGNFNDELDWLLKNYEGEGSESLNEFAERDSELRGILWSLWSEAWYGYHESGYVGGDELAALIPEALIERDRLAGIRAGQTTLDLKED